MLHRKWIFQTEFVIGLIMVVVLLAVITIISAGSFVTSSLPLMLTNEDTADTFNSTMPDRSLVFQVASGPGETPEEPEDTPGAETVGEPASFGDDRVFMDFPGAAAALAAIYIEPDGLNIYAIDPFTGVGQPAFQVLAEDMFIARQEADATGLPVLLGEGFGNSLYMLPGNQCQLNTTFPDSKVVSVIFAC